MHTDGPYIDAATRSEWERLQLTDAVLGSAYYFRNILHAVVMHHRQHQPPVAPCELLVSLMGLSPETTVLTAALVRPQRLVIVASGHSEHYCKQCINFLTEHELMKHEAIAVRVIDPTSHNTVFTTICDVLAGSSGRRIVDLTGGKKVMAAVAGYAAWNLDLPVCYLESRAYNQQMRRPEPGSERLLIFDPPVRTPE